MTNFVKTDFCPTSWNFDIIVSKICSNGLHCLNERNQTLGLCSNLTGAVRKQLYEDVATYIKAFDAKNGTKIYEAMVKEGFPVP